MWSCSECSTSRAELETGASRNAPIISRPTTMGWPCRPANSGTTAQVSSPAERNAFLICSIVAGPGAGRSTRVITAASRPRLSTSCNPTCSELNWPRSGFGLMTTKPALAFTMGASSAVLAPVTTITRSVRGCKARMAAERNVPPRHGSSALSRPMRDDAPAARMTPANEGARAMIPGIILHNPFQGGGAERRKRESGCFDRIQVRETYQGFQKRPSPRLSVSAVQIYLSLAEWLQLLENFSRLHALHVRQWRWRAAPYCDQLGHDRYRDLFRGDGANIDADRSVDPGQLLRDNAFLFQLFIDGDGFALRADHADVARRGLGGPAQHAHVVAVSASYDHNVRRFAGRQFR